MPVDAGTQAIIRWYSNRSASVAYAIVKMGILPPGFKVPKSCQNPDAEIIREISFPAVSLLS